jgi:hypothetical protein
LRIADDRAGKDWDATVVKIIENAISVREAFWTPYRRLGRMLNNQIQKMAADQDKAIEAKSADSVSSNRDQRHKRQPKRLLMQKPRHLHLLMWLNLQVFLQPLVWR